MLPAGVLAVVQAMAAIEQQRKERASTFWAEVQLQAGADRDTFTLIRVSLRATAEIVAQAAVGPPARCDEARIWLERTHPAIIEALLLDGEGRTVCGEHGRQAFGALPEWAEFSRAPRFTMGVPERASASGELVTTAYHPVPGNDAGIEAVAARIDLDLIHRIVTSRVQARIEARIEAGGEAQREVPFALIGNDGAVMVEQAAPGGGAWLIGDIDRLLAPRGATLTARAPDGTERLYASFPVIPGQVWWVSAAPVRSAADVAMSSQALALVTPAMLWLIAVAVVLMAVDRLVTRHVARLQGAADRIGQGELGLEVTGLGQAPLEIRRLGDAISGMASNLADREARLRDALATQRSLLLEVHHRVKNNLQMISSLMNMQIRRIARTSERGALQLLQDRIHSLALVHQSLYSTERLDHVALDQLVRELAEHLHQSLSPAGAEVRLRFRLAPVTLDAEAATPTALFITEAMANVFKHGVSDGGGQAIDIAQSVEDGFFSLSITNRVRERGMVEEMRGEPGRGLGLRLMEGFARQLGGTLVREETDRLFRVTLRAPLGAADRALAMRRGSAAAETATGLDPADPVPVADAASTATADAPEQVRDVATV